LFLREIEIHQLTLNGSSYDAKDHLLLGNNKSLPFKKVKQFLLVFPRNKKIAALMAFSLTEKMTVVTTHAISDNAPST